MPVVGNVKLDILSERMIGNGVWSPSNARDGPARGFTPSSHRNEKLLVRWRTCHSSRGDWQSSASPSAVDKISEFLGRDVRSEGDEFSGLFIFEFDGEGRVARHTIEHALQGGDWERKTRVVSVTDWLIGLAKGRRQGAEGLALGCEQCKIRVDERERPWRRG